MEKLYRFLPLILQNILVSMYNVLAYRKRYGGEYWKFRRRLLENRKLSLESLLEIQYDRFRHFVIEATNNSSYYKQTLYGKNIDLMTIDELPILTKETLRQHCDEIFTLSKRQSVIAKTGGTTGKSLEVRYTPSNMQERFAMLDDFRSRYGYKLGKRTAWFSGKDLLTSKDTRKHIFWKTDVFHKVRYYSTFHIKEDFLVFYVEDLIKYRPEYFVGFPSTILEIAKYGLANGYDYPANTIKAIFPTAETITLEMRETIEAFFKAKMYNQYASSEGAPFIFECERGRLHLELQSGVFEVLDEKDQPTSSGRLLVTSFTTEGTPLIRYDIGDTITLEDKSLTCNCGNNNPLVKEILGRIDDYVYSPENGKINLGNVSNTLKDTKGIIRFQVIQEKLETIEILVVKDEKIYTKLIERKFIQNWRDRIGARMKLSIKYVDEIPVEKSGKYRVVKNNIKHLLK